MLSPNEYKALDMETAAASAVAGRGGALGTTIKVVAIGGGLALAGLLLYSGLSTKAPRSLTDKDKEDFTTTQFPGPQLDTPRPQLDKSVVTIPREEPPPPPPPLQPPTTIAAPPLPVSPIQTMQDDGEARRLAELERQRLAEEERQKWARLRAGQMVVDMGGTGGTGVSAEEAKAANSDASTVAQEDDPNRRFLAQASRSKVEVAGATQNKRIDALVAQGSMIRGILETAIQSDLAGMVRAVTSEDVWSFDGRRVLIPMGTRLVGEYKSGLSTGQTRVFIVWTRLLRPDGVSVDLGSPGADDLGRAGMTGTVDKHYFEKFGAAVMLSLVGGGAQFLSSLGQNNNQYQTTTTTTYDPVTGRQTQTQSVPRDQMMLQARQIGAQQISQTLTQIANEALKDSIKIPPTIHVDQGSPIIVFVKRDLDFSALYPDPVKEALKEIKRERRAANRISR